MADKTALGDRMKQYERREAGRRCMPRLPICIRIDGKTFSKFTRGLARPYDARLSELMVQTTEYLVENTG
ncbi:MAG: tRNA(His) guanylyltransferase, partial [Myxococcota bacterium]